ncbi:MAG: M48 family metalloprotease [Candidatus Micrarchaeota archaeon]|nr:M48 family metalloprotease [Candidatus Micrarchaeota archaeon]
MAKTKSPQRQEESIDYPRLRPENAEKFYRLKDFIEKTCAQNGLESPKLVIRNVNAMSASAKVKPAPFAISISSNLIDKLPSDQLQAIAAHEIGHRKYHNSAPNYANFFLSLLNCFAASDAIFAACQIGSSVFSGLKNSLLVFGASSLLLYLNRIKLYKNEYEADEFAAKIASKESFINGLKNLHSHIMDAKAKRLPKILKTVLEEAKSRLLSAEKSISDAENVFLKIAKAALKPAVSASKWALGKLERSVCELERTSFFSKASSLYASLFHLSPYSTHPTIKQREKALLKFQSPCQEKEGAHES